MTTDATSRTRPRRILGMLALVAIVFALVAPSVAAQDEVDSDLVELELATVGPVVAGEEQWIDAIATISAERAVTGRLRIIDNPPQRPQTTWEYDLDLAAGSEVTIPFTATSSWQGVRVDATLDSGNAIVARADLQAFPDGRPGQTLIGTLGIDDAPRLLPELGTDLDAAVVAADSTLTSLDRMSTLIADRATMRELTGTARGDAIEAWLRGGGQLIIDGPSGSLGDALVTVPTANPDRFLVGAGSLLYDVDWREGVPLGGYSGSTTMARLLDEQGFGSGASGELIVLAGVGLPRPATVAIMLLGYSAIAGPLLFVVTARRRIRRRIWLFLPVLAVGLAAAVLVVGLINGAGRDEAHITIVEVDESGSQATTNVLIGSRFGSNRAIEAPTGWTYLGQNSGANERPVQVRPGLDGISVAMELPPSGNGNLRLSGPAPSYDGMIRIENIRVAGADARLGGPGLMADFVNDSGERLEGVVAFLGTQRVALGTVDAGETQQFAIEFDDNDGRLMRELLEWPRVGRDWDRNGPVARPSRNEGDTPIEAGAWTQWRIEQGAGAIPAHVLGVAGWTDGLGAPVGDIGNGNTALFVRTPVPVDVLGDAWTVTSYRPSDPDAEVPFVDGNFFGWSQDYRFTLGPGVETADLSFEVGPESSGVSVLIDGEWVNADLPDAFGRQNILIALPDEAAASGEIIARALIPEWEWNAPQALFVTERSDAAEDVDWSADNRPFRNTDGPFFEDSFETIVIELVTIELDVGETVRLDGDVFDHEAIEYEVSLDEGDTLTATLRSDTGDSYLEIYDGNNLMASNDDFGGSLDSQIVFTSSNGGAVQVRALGLAGQPLSYALELVREGE